MTITVDIHKKLGDFTLDIAFSSDADRIGILGASGCGKSLTLKSIAGIERPDSGRIVVDDRVLFDSSSRIDLKPQKRRVGYMFQNYALFPTMTVEANIAAGLHLPPVQRLERTREMIHRFRLQGLEKHLPGQLSGGQQQRVALARIMAYQPDLILLDEPFSALDQHLKERLQHEMMQMLEGCGSQVIMVSHSRDELYRFSEDLLILEKGELLAAGKTQQLFDHPGTVAVARMTGCKNFSRAERSDSHHLYLTDWDMELHLQQEIPEDITAIGYRAHFFQPIWGRRQENCLPFRLSGMDELPFERRYYLFPTDAAEEAGALGGTEMSRESGGSEGYDDRYELICWFVQDRERKELDARPAPDYLQLREDAVMLLRG